MSTVLVAVLLLAALAVAGVLYFIMRPSGKQAFADAGTPFTPKPNGAVADNLGNYLQGLQFPKG
jgi:hypothetical protein